MVNLGEIVLRELNPANDLSRFNFNYNHSNLREFFIEGLVRNGSVAFLGGLKCAIRGGIALGLVGAAVGAFSGLVSGQDIVESLTYDALGGVMIGINADPFQYLCRYLWRSP